MNKIKSEEDLYDKIDEEYTWRLHEIDTLKGFLQRIVITRKRLLH